jgi:trehalose-phosphatase
MGCHIRAENPATLERVKMTIPKNLSEKIRKQQHSWLLLDYDGTLADFSPTPDDVLPDDALITLIEKLADSPRFEIAIMSGRRLSHIEKLLPIKGIWLAGSYGLEMRLPSGEYLYRADFDALRPKLEKLKPIWTKLMDGKKGFYLEDKRWSLAIHARYAEDRTASNILEEARLAAQRIMTDGNFNLLGGYKFLEIAPKNADKGLSVSFLLERYLGSNTLPIYIGDDDKDERAFPVVQEFGGIAGCVCSPPRKTCANFTFDSPNETRKWLQILLDLV